jgi:hypothetical protein
MSRERLPLFLEVACEWWAVADSLRASCVSEHPALTVWREAAWCHLLFTSGRYDAIVARLRVVLASVAGELPRDARPQPADEAEVLAAASDVFARIRLAVSARYPNAFALPTAA